MEKSNHRSILEMALTAFAIIVSCCFNLIGQIRAYPDKASANILSVVQVKANPDLKIEPAPGETNPLQVFTRDRKYTAYVLCVPLKSKADPERCAYRAYFDDYTGPARIYEIRGEPEEVTRPIDSLKWLDNERLSYERWMNPHFGHRYVINVRLRKQVAAYTITDMPR